MADVDEKEKLLKKVKTIVRSLLLSAKGGVLKQRLLADYRSFIGSPMPLRELGYRSLDHFVYDNSDLIREGISSTGEEVYTGVADAATAHVARMVAKQKKPTLKKARKNIQRGTFGQSYGSRPRVPPSRFRKYPSWQPSRGFNKPFQQSVPQYRQYPLFRQALQPSRPEQSNSYGQHTSVHVPYQHSLIGHVNRHVPVATASFNPSTSTFSSTSLWSTRNKASHTGRPFNTSSAPFLKSQSRDSGGIPPWKESFRDAIPVNSVGELLQSKDQYHGKLIVLNGYPGGRDKLNSHGSDFYRLLFFHGYNVQNDPQHRLNPPALSIFFQSPDWDTKIYSDPERLVEGTHIRLYGRVEYKLWQHRKKHNHSINVVFYEKIMGTGSTLPSHEASTYKTYKVEGMGNIPIQITSTSSGTGSTRTCEVTRFDTKKAQGVNSPSLTTSGVTEQRSNDLEQWLRSTLRGKDHGLWAKVLLNKYRTYFQRDPPQNFLKTISTFSYISVESVTEDTLIVFLVDKPPLSPSPSLPASVEIPSTDDELMDVLVVLATNPTEFFIHLVGEGYSEALEALHDEMQSHFATSNAPAPVLSNIPKLCAHFMDVGGEKQWTRALVESTSKTRDNAVLIYYPDYGNMEEVAVQELRELPHRFWQLPFQAVQCSLDGFEDTSADAGKKFVELAFEKQFFAKFIERNNDVYTVELISSDNQRLSSQLLDILRPVDTLQPQLPKAGSGDRVTVTLVDINMYKEEISVLVAGTGTRRLADLVALLNDTYSTKNSARDMMKRSSLVKGMMCCCKFTDDDSWYRVCVESLSGDKVLVEYVDYGNREEVDIVKLRKPLNHYLFDLPSQAVRCRLHGIPLAGGQWTDLAVHFLLEYLDCEGLQLEVMNDGTVTLLFEDENINQLMLKDPALFSIQPVQASTPEASGEDSLSLSEQLLTEKSVPDGDLTLTGLSICDSRTESSARAVTSSQKAHSKVLERDLASPRPLPAPKTLDLRSYTELHTPNQPQLQTFTHNEPHTFSGPETPPEPHSLYGPPGSHIPLGPQMPPGPQTPPGPIGPQIPSVPQTPHIPFGPQVPPGPHIFVGPQTPPGPHTPPIVSQGPRSPPGHHTPLDLQGTQTLPEPYSGTLIQVSLKSKSASPTSIQTVAGNFKYEELTVHKPTSVMVAYATNPSDFTVHLQRNADTLLELNKKLHRYCCTASSQLSEFPENTPCAALNSDGTWYRGVVMKSPQILTNSGKVYVCFVDYGDCELVKYQDLRVLPVGFLDLPFQAIKCQLAGVASVQDQEWGSEACSTFLNLVSGVQLIALANSTCSGFCIVRLMDVAKNIVINDYLVSLGLVQKT